jgi:hypothetical protein
MVVGCASSPPSAADGTLRSCKSLLRRDGSWIVEF